MMMFQLVSAVALLVSPAVTSPAPHTPEDNLNRIIDLAAEYNTSLSKGFYVEDLSHLKGECEDKFFCKVYEILHNHTHFGQRRKENELVRNLKVYINARNANCTELLKEMTPTGDKKPIPELVKDLTACARQVNLSGAKRK